MNKMSYVTYEGKKYYVDDGRLDLSYIGIRDIHEIEGLETLKDIDTLYFYQNQISEIHGLENLTSLERLSLRNNNITEIKGLETLTNLRQLYLENNQIVEIKGLEDLRNLETLHLKNNQISEIKGLENLKNLQKLFLKDNSIPKDLLEELGGLYWEGNAKEPQKFVEYCQIKIEKYNTKILEEFKKRSSYIPQGVYINLIEPLLVEKGISFDKYKLKIQEIKDKINRIPTKYYDFILNNIEFFLDLENRNRLDSNIKECYPKFGKHIYREFHKVINYITERQINENYIKDNNNLSQIYDIFLETNSRRNFNYNIKYYHKGESRITLENKIKEILNRILRLNPVFVDQGSYSDDDFPKWYQLTCKINGLNFVIDYIENPMEIPYNSLYISFYLHRIKWSDLSQQKLNLLKNIISEINQIDTLLLKSNFNLNQTIAEVLREISKKSLDRKDDKKMQKIYEFDFAFSFAGEDRDTVRKVRDSIVLKGIRVFFDEDFEWDLIGKNLSDRFKDIYGKNTKYVVVFISKHYKVKYWTDFEFQIAREEANSRKEEFILPIRLDDTILLGVKRDIGYSDYRIKGTRKISELLDKKLEDFNKRYNIR